MVGLCGYYYLSTISIITFLRLSGCKDICEHRKSIFVLKTNKKVYIREYANVHSSGRSAQRAEIEVARQNKISMYQ
jgi:hypothetical protein